MLPVWVSSTEGNLIDGCCQMDKEADDTDRVRNITFFSVLNFSFIYSLLRPIVNSGNF